MPSRRMASLWQERVIDLLTPLATPRLCALVKKFASSSDMWPPVFDPCDKKLGMDKNGGVGCSGNQGVGVRLVAQIAASSVGPELA